MAGSAALLRPLGKRVSLHQDRIPVIRYTIECSGNTDFVCGTAFYTGRCHCAGAGFGVEPQMAGSEERFRHKDFKTVYAADGGAVSVFLCGTGAYIRCPGIDY